MIDYQMSPEEFDRRGLERRKTRRIRRTVSAANAMSALAFMALSTFVAFRVVWGAMAP